MTTAPSTLPALVSEILDMYRGDWLGVTQIRTEIERYRHRLGTTGLLCADEALLVRRACQQVASASSVQKRLVERVRWWQDDLRPQTVVELRLTWPSI